MTITEIAAWYAATIATAVFIWDIIKWLRNGPRLRITATCNVSYPDARVNTKRLLDDGGEAAELAIYCHIEVLNVGSQPTTLISIEAANKSGPKGIRVSCSGPAFTVHAGSHSLPALLGAGEMWSARIEMSRLESIAEHGSPVIQVRASHRTKAIETVIDLKPKKGGAK